MLATLEGMTEDKKKATPGMDAARSTPAVVRVARLVEEEEEEEEEVGWERPGMTTSGCCASCCDDDDEDDDVMAYSLSIPSPATAALFVVTTSELLLL